MRTSPGWEHGTIIKRTDIVPYRYIILGVQAKVQQMIREGKSEKEVLAAKVTAPYDAKVPGGLLPAGAGTIAGPVREHGVFAAEGRRVTLPYASRLLSSTLRTDALPFYDPL